MFAVSTILNLSIKFINSAKKFSHSVVVDARSVTILVFLAKEKARSALLGMRLLTAFREVVDNTFRLLILFGFVKRGCEA